MKRKDKDGERGIGCASSTRSADYTMEFGRKPLMIDASLEDVSLMMKHKVVLKHLL